MVFLRKLRFHYHFRAFSLIFGALSEPVLVHSRFVSGGKLASVHHGLVLHGAAKAETSALRYSAMRIPIDPSAIRAATL